MAARKEAIAAIPFDKIEPAYRDSIANILHKTSVYRRMPTSVVRCDPDLYLFILNHPEILANIWQIMEIENVVLKPTSADSYQADDGDGTKGDVKFLHRSHDMQLVYAQGHYDGPLFTQPITGNCVLLVRTSYAREPDGNYYITTTMDAFVHLDHVGLDFLAKTFQPLVCRVADYNFLVTAHFLETLSQTAETNQRGLQRLAANLQNIDPQLRQEFAALALTVYERAQIRETRHLASEARLVERPAPFNRLIE